jgi:aminoglycoside phosphotransferase
LRYPLRYPLHYPQLSAARAHSLLLEGQVKAAPEQIAIEHRDGRWLVEWNSNQLAWFAASLEGATRLATERKVLALVQNSCSFAVPETLYVAADGSFDIRTKLEGIVDPPKAHEHLRNNPRAALQLGRWTGEALAQLHAVIKSDYIPHWLPRKVSWPEPTSWILERLPAVIGEGTLAAEIAALLSHYENLQIADDDRVLAHTDLGLHNIVLATDSFAPLGIIDFDAAAYADRHIDFRYLILDFPDTTLLTSACQTYAAITGKALQPERILLYNAVSACCYLAYRAGIPAETPWCGRTLNEDLAWTTQALERFRTYQTG